MALLEDSDCISSLLPILTELALAETTFDAHQHSAYATKRVEQRFPLKMLALHMCRRDPQGDPYKFIAAVQSLSEIAIDILRPIDFLGPENTEESHNAGFFMFATMLTMWEPFLPYPCYASNDDSEYESEDHDHDDIYMTTEVENLFAQWMEEDMP